MSEKIAPTTLDFSPTNCRNPATRKTRNTPKITKNNQTSIPAAAAYVAGSAINGRPKKPPINVLVKNPIPDAANGPPP